MVTRCMTCKVEIPTGRRYCSRACHNQGFRAYTNAMFRSNRAKQEYYRRHPMALKYVTWHGNVGRKAGKGGEGVTATSPNT